jgi:hypothetical protein
MEATIKICTALMEEDGGVGELDKQCLLYPLILLL